MHDPWTLGYRAGLSGVAYDQNPLEGTQGASAWAFGCAQGWRDRNAYALSQLLSRISGANPLEA